MWNRTHQHLVRRWNYADKAKAGTYIYMATLCRLQEIILNAAVPYANLLLSPSINLSWIIFFCLCWTGHLKKRKKNEGDKRETGLSGLKSEPNTLNYQLTIRSWDRYREGKTFHVRLRFLEFLDSAYRSSLFWLQYIQQMTVLLV